MFKKILLSGVIVASFFSVATLAAPKDPTPKPDSSIYKDVKVYLKGMTGYSFVSQDFTTIAGNMNMSSDLNGGLFGAAIGVYIPKTAIRTEFEYNYKTKMTDSQNIAWTMGAPNIPLDTWIKAQTFMINGYYDFDTKTKIRPYLGLGIGLSYMKSGSTIFMRQTSDDGTDFAYSVQAGVGYELTPEWTLDAGIRYLHSGYKDGYDSMDMLVGLRYDF